MKKLFLVAGLLVASMSFAKPVETKQEEVTLVKVTEITNDTNNEQKKDLLRICIEVGRVAWYQGTYTDMYGTYDLYTIEVRYYCF